jgi:hypothetical protein
LKHFLAVLATDPDTLAEYLRNAEEVMNEAGLSPEDIAVLKSGDPAALEALLNRGGPTVATPRPAPAAPVYGAPVPPGPSPAGLVPAQVLLQLAAAGLSRPGTQATPGVPVVYEPHHIVPSVTYVVVFEGLPGAGTQPMPGVPIVHEPAHIHATVTYVVKICLDAEEPATPRSPAQRPHAEGATFVAPAVRAPGRPGAGGRSVPTLTY